MSDQFVVRLDGGKPWGFTLQGGADFRSPLKIGKVTPGGKASAAGLIAGDYILAINDTSWEGLKHVEAQQLVVAATDHVVLKCTKLMPSLGLQAPKTTQTPSSSSFTYGSGVHVPPSPTTTPSPKPTPPTEEGTAPTQGVTSHPIPEGTAPTQGVTSSHPIPAGTAPTQGATSSHPSPAVLAKPPPPPVIKKPPSPPVNKAAPPPPPRSSSNAQVTTPAQHKEVTLDPAAGDVSRDGIVQSVDGDGVGDVVSRAHEEGEEGILTNETSGGVVTTPTAPVTTPQSTDGPMSRRQGDDKESLDAMLDHIDDLVSGMVADPPPSSHSPPASSRSPPTSSHSLPPPSLPSKANNRHSVEGKIEAAASVMVTKEPGWYKQMLHNIHQTSGDEVFVEAHTTDTTADVYDERGLRIRKSSGPREPMETSKIVPRPKSETTPTSTRTSSQTLPPAVSGKPRVTSASSSNPSPSCSFSNTSATTLQRGTPAPTTVSKEAVLSESKKPSVGVRAANGSQVEYSKDYWKQKEGEEAQKKSEPTTHRKSSTTHVSKTIHPLLSSEIAQEEGKSVSSDQPQQSVFERIEAEKLNKALESSQLMGKLEKEGVPSTLVTAVAADHKETGTENKQQMVKEKKLPPPPAKKAKALYNFEAKTPKELSFKKGAILELSHTVDDNWLEGYFEGKKGIFPKAYVEIIPDSETPEPMELNTDIPTQFGIAKYDFNGHTLKELSLQKGDIVSILRKVDANWLEGMLNDKKGIFPLAYVEMVAEGGDNPSSPSS